MLKASSTDNDVLDGLLNLNKQHDHELSCNDIKHLLLVETDLEILGYAVPKNAQVLVNAWAIGRDSRTWSNPNSFEPERFLESEIDVKGRDFQLIPFSGGRRICPGLLFGHRMVHLMLASLLHSFDWKLEDGMKPEDMDMDEKFWVCITKSPTSPGCSTKP
ncbi:Cytochrome P450 76C4 [Vitis vinifera]|uniref:Cytochrome P450 76C4 n=1 Tax=Vitis vinifera TaxID=29760 RepID=A0A438IWA6_VITVI|nr:Cytochrome P450 76C4 [Vitis vinifera]